MITALCWVITQRVEVNALPTFRDNLSVATGCPRELPLLAALHPEERSYHLLRGGSLKSRKLQQY